MFIFFNELLSTLFINLYSNEIRIIFILFGLILTITVFSNILGIQGQSLSICRVYMQK